MKTQRIIFTSIFVLAFIAALAGCGSSNKKGGQDNIKTYSGSASFGDILTFSINSSSKVYEIRNETTHVTESHTYTDSNDPNLSGVKEVNYSGKTYYAVELDGKIIVTNFPSGRPDSKLCFGVSSVLDNSGRTAQFAGNYTWIQLREDSNDPGGRSWGPLTNHADGTYNMDIFFSKNDLPDAKMNLFQMTNSTCTDYGTWVSNGTHKERVDVHSNSTTFPENERDYTGFAYVSADSTVYLMDLGEGNGFMLGIKNPSSHYTEDQIAGTYKFVDVNNNGIGGAGTFAIDSSGNGAFYHIDQSGTKNSGSLGAIQPCPGLNNAFYYSTPDYKVYLIFTGSIIAEITFGLDGTFISYGAGAKI